MWAKGGHPCAVAESSSEGFAVIKGAGSFDPSEHVICGHLFQER